MVEIAYTILHTIDIRRIIIIIIIIIIPLFTHGSIYNTYASGPSK